MDKICFTTCANDGFRLGLMGLVTSIRKFYSSAEAEIVAFVEETDAELTAFCRDHAVELHLFDSIGAWRRPLLQAARFRDDATHFYHPRHAGIPGLDHHLDRVDTDVLAVHHLHPLNVKAYCTVYCACVKEAKYIVHIDSDAFLLARVDDLFERHGQPDTVIGFDDGDDPLDNLERIHGVAKPADFDPRTYAFNAGIVFYVNGPRLREMMKEFCFYIDSCVHYTHSGSFGDQGVLRALVAKHHLTGAIRYVREDAVNWNPTWFRADDLTFDADRQRWMNGRNGRQQFIWHGAGGEKLWTGRYNSPSVMDAWRWVGGRREGPRYDQVKGSLIKPHCELLGKAIVEFAAATGKRSVRVLEIGTQYGRTAIAFCTILAAHGLDCRVDTFDIYAPSPDYPTDHAKKAEVEANVAAFGLQDKIALHTVEGCEDISPHVRARPDVAFIDGDHRYKHVLADCFVARALVGPSGLILGDDLQMPAVRKALCDYFGAEGMMELNPSLWAVRT